MEEKENLLQELRPKVSNYAKKIDQLKAERFESEAKLSALSMELKTITVDTDSSSEKLRNLKTTLSESTEKAAELEESKNLYNKNLEKQNVFQEGRLNKVVQMPREAESLKKSLDQQHEMKKMAEQRLDSL